MIIRSTSVALFAASDKAILLPSILTISSIELPCAIVLLMLYRSRASLKAEV